MQLSLPHPPAKDPTLNMKKKGSAEAPTRDMTEWAQRNNTYRDQEEHTRDHDRERSPAKDTRVNIPQ